MLLLSIVIICSYRKVLFKSMLGMARLRFQLRQHQIKGTFQLTPFGLSVYPQLVSNLPKYDNP